MAVSPRHVGMSVCVILVVVLTTATAAPLPPEGPAAKLLYQANQAVRRGAGGEAVEILKELQKLFPKTPEADEAQRLLARLASLEVLVDRSHECRHETAILGRYLKEAGIGVTLSDASLEHIADRLVDYEVILIWQQTKGVSFTDVEITMLKEYVKEGGRLLVIGTTQPQGQYPLRRLLAAFGCPLRAPDARADYGRGKVTFFDNTGLFASGRLADPTESRQEVVEVFKRCMPYESLGTSTVDDHVLPEKEEEIGFVTIQYSGRLEPSARKTAEVLVKVIEHVQMLYREPLPKGMTVRVLPRDYSGWVGGVAFAPGALQEPADVARDLTRACTLYGLFPTGTWISYPPWVTHGWCDLVALRFCYKLGFRREAEDVRRRYLNAWSPPAPGTPDGIDLSVSRAGTRWDYIGKAQWTLETLEKTHGKNLLSRLRRTLKTYAVAGRLENDMSTRNVVFYLSHALHTDMFAWFGSIGTPLLPMKLDYDELEKVDGK